MKIVIDIPEKAYELLKNEGVDWLGAEHILNAVANGTPLPKGHGRLIDEKVIFGMANKESNWVYDLSDMPDYIAGLPAIIPAESEEKNDRRRTK